MKKVLIVILALAVIVTPIFAKDDHVKATDMQEVNLSDTFENVVTKIGDPQQIVSKEFTADGKEKVVWLYEAIERPKTNDLPAKDKLMAEQVYQAKRANNPPYLIIFINGKVMNITKQQQGTVIP